MFVYELLNLGLYESVLGARKSVKSPSFPSSCLIFDLLLQNGD